MSLLDSNKFDIFCNSSPQNVMAEIKKLYGLHFYIVHLKTELNRIYMLDDYKEKLMSKIIIYMKHNNLDVVFSKVYKLAELILIFLFTTATAERSFSALKRIN